MSTSILGLVYNVRVRGAALLGRPLQCSLYVLGVCVCALRMLGSNSIWDWLKMSLKSHKNLDCIAGNVACNSTHHTAITTSPANTHTQQITHTQSSNFRCPFHSPAHTAHSSLFYLYETINYITITYYYIVMIIVIWRKNTHDKAKKMLIPWD